jgi:hypothetical protein
MQYLLHEENSNRVLEDILITQVRSDWDIYVNNVSKMNERPVNFGNDDAKKTQRAGGDTEVSWLGRVNCQGGVISG